MDLYTACSSIEGFGDELDPTEDQIHEAWQYLIDTGAAWQLQGWYGRVAVDLIEQGLCSRPSH